MESHGFKTVSRPIHQADLNHNPVWDRQSGKGSMAQTAADDRGRSLGPLRRLAPYIGRYKGLVTGAAVSLVLAAVTTLALPVAVRRMIDHGFSASDSVFIASYFSMLVVMAAALALASAGRYYFVITLGERVVADLRRDVFAHAGIPTGHKAEAKSQP